MIGVAFSLAGTLGCDDGIYRAACSRLVTDHFHQRSKIADGRVRKTIRRLVERYFRPQRGAREALALLDELHVPHAILSEGWDAIEARKTEILRFHGKLIVEGDADAPDAWPISAFAAIASALDLPADRIWFVGSDPERDIRPAHAAGFHTIWVNREGAPYPSHITPPDHTIVRLAEVLDIIGLPYTRAAMLLTGLIDRA